MAIARTLALWKLLPLLGAAILLVACNDDSSTGGTTSSAAPTTNAAPATSGSAPAATTGTATLSWEAPVQNTNGSILNDLTGYTIYYGTNSAALTQTIIITNPSETTYVVKNLSAGTYYFSVAADASDGTQSSQSTIGSKTIM